MKDEQSTLDQDKVEEELQKTSSNHIETIDRPHTGKLKLELLCCTYYVQVQQ